MFSHCFTIWFLCSSFTMLLLGGSWENDQNCCQITRAEFICQPVLAAPLVLCKRNDVLSTEMIFCCKLFMEAQHAFTTKVHSLVNLHKLNIPM